MEWPAAYDDPVDAPRSRDLAYRSHAELADGFTQILTGCLPLLRPGGHVVITARPYRHHGELVDIPGMVVAAGVNVGLELVEECIALICGVRNVAIVPRASFFQQKNVRAAIAAGDPQWAGSSVGVLPTATDSPTRDHTRILRRPPTANVCTAWNQTRPRRR